jgi:hypothetical protein
MQRAEALPTTQHMLDSRMFGDSSYRTIDTVLPLQADCFFVGALIELPTYNSLGSQHMWRYAKGDAANAKRC